MVAAAAGGAVARVLDAGQAAARAGSGAGGLVVGVDPVRVELVLATWTGSVAAGLVGPLVVATEAGRAVGLDL